MKKNILMSNIITCFMLTLSLAACNGGGGSSSSPAPSPSPTVGNFTQLTPDGGVQAPSNPQSTTLDPLPPSDYFTVLTMSNNGTLYAGTAYGAIYQIVDATNGFSNLGTPIVSPDPQGNSIVALGANQNSYDYTTLNESHVSQGTGTVITSESSITAIALAANGIAYYGTLDGNIGTVGDNKGIVPFDDSVTCIDPNICPISAIGLTSNNASSGKKGVAALQLSEESIPVFNANQAESGTWAVGFDSAVSCLEQDGSSGSWVVDDGAGIPSSVQETFTFTYTNESGQQVESTTTTSVPQFITTMLASTNGKIYVGTNVFNVFQTSGCNARWVQVNTVPLGTVQNGSVGVTSIGLVDNQLFAVTNNSESVISEYQYNGSTQ